MSRATLVRSALLGPLLLQFGKPTVADASSKPPVVVLGATGGIGSQVVASLLQRGVPVIAVVRSSAKLPSNALITPVVTANVLDLDAEQFSKTMQHADAVVSCLGHDMDHMWAEPKMLCRDASRLVYDAAELRQASSPLKYVTVSTTGVDSPDGLDKAQNMAERGLLSTLEAILPPVKDNVANVKFLAEQAASSSAVMEFVAVRPDDLVDGPATEYVTYSHRPMGLFDARVATRANVGRFMAELATSEDAWRRWKNSYPVVIDKVQPADRPPTPEGWVA